MGKTPSKKAPIGHYSHNVQKTKNATKKGVSAPKLRRVKRRSPQALPYLTLDEKDRFFKAIESPRDRALFRLLFHHGLRASEIGLLEFSHYRRGRSMDMDRINITRLKGSVSGETTVVPAAALAMRAWMKKRGTKQGCMFPSRLGTPISRKMIFVLMRKYCKMADVPLEKAHPHCLKHSCCTHLVSDKRESIMDVQAHVGHVSISSTMKYAKMMDRAHEERAKRLRDWK